MGVLQGRPDLRAVSAPRDGEASETDDLRKGCALECFLRAPRLMITRICCGQQKVR